MATVEEITELLSDLTFPATREQIIQHAHETGATEDVIDDLRTLPNEDFADVMDIWHSLGAIEEEPLAAGSDIPSQETDDVKPHWLCPTCEVTLARENDYRRHMQQEHGESPAHIEP